MTLQNLEITRMIWSNSERPEQFLKQKYFSSNMYIGTIKMEIGTSNCGAETYRNKLEIFFCFQRTMKGRNFFEMPTKNYVFFTAGSWEKDIIFSGHLKQILALLVLSEL